jgi:DNA polymerase III delta prime subunit
MMVLTENLTETTKGGNNYLLDSSDEDSVFESPSGSVGGASDAFASQWHGVLKELTRKVQKLPGESMEHSNVLDLAHSGSGGLVCGSEGVDSPQANPSPGGKNVDKTHDPAEATKLSPSGTCIVVDETKDFSSDDSVPYQKVFFERRPSYAEVAKASPGSRTKEEGLTLGALKLKNSDIEILTEAIMVGEGASGKVPPTVPIPLRPVSDGSPSTSMEDAAVGIYGGSPSETRDAPTLGVIPIWNAEKGVSGPSDTKVSPESMKLDVAIFHDPISDDNLEGSTTSTAKEPEDLQVEKMYQPRDTPGGDTMVVRDSEVPTVNSITTKQDGDDAFSPDQIKTATNQYDESIAQEAESVAPSVASGLESAGSFRRRMQNLLVEWHEYLVTLEAHLHAGDAPSLDIERSYIQKLQRFVDQAKHFLEKKCFRTEEANHESVLGFLGGHEALIQDPNLFSLEIIQDLVDRMSMLIKSIRPVDLRKLIGLLESVQSASDKMRGKDVVLLLGPTGAGKTTTLLYFAGTKFENVVTEDGFDHYEPVHFLDEKLAAFKTSSSAKSATRSVLSWEIDVHGNTFTVCDTPGVFDTESVELEIAHRAEFVRAISCAKRVKPVLVLSSESFGSRFRDIKEILLDLYKMVGNVQAPMPVGYVFTKCSRTEIHRISRKFNALRRGVGRDLKLKAIVDDVILKTSTAAKVVFPEDCSGQDLLLDLWNEGPCIEIPADNFKPYLSQSASQQLHSMLHLTMKGLRESLDDSDYEYAVNYATELVKIAKLLPEETGTVYQETKAMVEEHITINRSKLANLARVVCKESDFANAVQSFKSNLVVVMKSDDLRPFCETNPEEAEVFCFNVIENLVASMGETLVSWNHECTDILTLMRLQGSVFVELKQLKVLHGAISEYPFSGQAILAYWEGVDQLGSMVTSLIKKAKADFFMKRCGNDLESRFTFIFEVCHRVVNDPWTLGNERSSLIRCDIEKLETDLRKYVLSLGESLDSIVARLHGLQVGKKAWASETWALLVEAQDPRAFLAYILDTKCFVLFSPLEGAQESLNAFDISLLAYFQSLHTDCNKWYEDQRKSQHKNPVRISKALGGLRGKLAEACQLLQSIDRWSLSCRTEIDEVLAKLTDLSNTVIVEQDKASAEVHSLRNDLGGACEEAKVLHTKLLNPELNAGSILVELVGTGLWDSMSAICENIGWVSSFWDRRYGILGEKMDAIKGLFCDQLGYAVDCICKSKDGYGISVAKRILKRNSEQLILVINLLALDPCHPLVRHVVSRAVMAKNIRLSRTLQYMSAVFCTSRRTPEAAKEDRDFNKMNAFLSMIQQCGSILETFRGLSSTGMHDSSSGSALFQECKTLVDNIATLPYYEDALEDAKGMLSSCSLTIRSFSFADAMETIEEDGRLELYRELAGVLKALDGSKCMQSHIDSDFLNGTYNEAVKILESEARRQFSRLRSLLSSFPQYECDFDKIQQVLLHLRCFSTCLGDVDSTIADACDEFKNEMERTKHDIIENLASSSIENQSSGGLVEQFFLLKKASLEISFWRAELTTCIDDCLKKAVDGAQNPDSFLLDLSLSLKSFDGDDSSLAQQLLADHKCFEGAINSIFNDRTARQDIHYVIGAIFDSDGSEEAGVILEMHRVFKTEYENQVVLGLKRKRIETEEEFKFFLKGLTELARKKGISKEEDYATQVASISAYVFAYWSLTNLNSLVTRESGEDNYLSESKYLKKPHAAQLVALWSLLNCTASNTKALANHFVEVKTGEGKSIVFASASIILSLFGCNVHCVCYSDYLSLRDYRAFSYMFRAFGVTDNLKYSTLWDLLSIFCDGERTTRLVKDKLCANESPRTSSDEKRERLSVLLVDEVDVFFKDEIFGETVDLSVYLKVEPPSGKELVLYIWNNCQVSPSSSILQSREASAVLSQFSSDLGAPLKLMMTEMFNSARRIHSGRCEPYEIRNDTILHKHADGLQHDLVYGFDTLFLYVMEFEIGRISAKALEWQCSGFGLTHSILSYAEVPLSFDLILGVTGTLKATSSIERDVLKDMYEIEKYTYIPSVYGCNKLSFRPNSDQGMFLSF